MNLYVVYIFYIPQVYCARTVNTYVMKLLKKSKSIPPESKLDILKLLVEETQKYELLTTDQYLPQIELVVDLLEELSKALAKHK